jgi:hypothetical protein
VHCIRTACSFAFASAGKSSAAKMAMIAITTNNSIKVKAADPEQRNIGDFFDLTLILFIFSALSRLVGANGLSLLHCFPSTFSPRSGTMPSRKITHYLLSESHRDGQHNRSFQYSAISFFAFLR